MLPCSFTFSSPLIDARITDHVPFISDPAPVAFSSGAPGSAQATGGANGSNGGGSGGNSSGGSGGTAKPSGASTLAVSNVLALAGTALAVVVAGFSML